MKPVVTWVLLANAEIAYVVVNSGPGKGFVKPNGKTWRAMPPVGYADDAGLGHSIAGPSQAAKTRRDPNALAEARFASEVAQRLADFYRRAAFDRLILVAAPHMLGELRSALKGAVKDSLLVEIDKDLTKANLQDLPDLLADVIAA
jgi:protein required for attachment to host cells